MNHSRTDIAYWRWHYLFGLACWLGLHGPRKANGDRWTRPLAHRVIRVSHRFWRERFAPDW